MFNRLMFSGGEEYVCTVKYSHIPFCDTEAGESFCNGYRKKSAFVAYPSFQRHFLLRRGMPG